MKYEIVALEQKVVVGVSDKTSNEDPQMGSIIGSLWTRLYESGAYGTIQNKVNDHAIGLYSDYIENGYSVTCGCQVEGTGNQGELTEKIIPAGRYAKFSVHGDMVETVAKAWGEIWRTELNRSYTGDFEEYTNSDCKNADVDIYVALQ